MHVITGDSRSRAVVNNLKQQGWGRMVIERNIDLYDGERWGFDNGAYVDWTKGREFDNNSFSRRLEKFYALGTPCLAVVPDIVGGGLNSLEFSNEWLPKLPADWPWYLAVQDGMAVHDVESVLGGYSGIFLGGSNAFKAEAPVWREVATKQGLPFHYARAGTPRKIIHAKSVGADSLDSAFPLWSKERWSWFVRIVNHGHPQRDLFIIDEW